MFMPARTPNLRCLPEGQARIVGALRYMHVARRIGRYSECGLGIRLGSWRAVLPFHVLAEALGSVWPEPICLHPICLKRLSHDEMMIVDIAGAAAEGDRGAVDRLLEDMVSARGRDGVWLAARRLMRVLAG